VTSIPVSDEILQRAISAAERVRHAEQIARGGLSAADVDRIVRDCFAGLEPPDAEGTLPLLLPCANHKASTGQLCLPGLRACAERVSAAIKMYG
jgi:hypothetical protein